MSINDQLYCIIDTEGSNMPIGDKKTVLVITEVSYVFFKIDKNKNIEIIDLGIFRLRYDLREYMKDSKFRFQFNWIKNHYPNTFKKGYYYDKELTSYNSDDVKEIIINKIKSFNCEVYAKGIQLENLFFNNKIKINDLTKLGCPKYDDIKDKVAILNEMKKKISSEMLYELQNELLNDVLLNSDVEQHISLNECLVFAYYLKLNLS